MVGFQMGSQVWYYNSHVASYPCDSNTRKGIFLGVDFVCPNTQVTYVKVQDFDGEVHHLELGCVSLSDPRTTYQKPAFPDF